MTTSIQVAAVDLGASSGRVFLGTYDGNRLGISEAHRFRHAARMVGGRLRWDTAQIYGEILSGLRAAAGAAEAAVAGISVDGWGVDYGLLGHDGALLADPVHYRDARTAGMVAQAHQTMSDEELYASTGVSSWNINTLYQLLSEPRQTDGAERLLFIPDLFQHWLSGSGASERTIASTSQMLNTTGFEWDRDVLGAFDLNLDLLPPLVVAATDLGPVVPWVQDEVGLSGARVVMSAAHDSAAAALGVPRPPAARVAWVSSGTWSVVGVDADGPVTSAAARAARLSNEPAPAGGTSITRNVMGMWLLQECRRCWSEDGVTERDLVRLAAEEPNDPPLIDPDDPLLAPPGNIPARIRKLAGGGCFDFGTKGAIVRCALESVAAKTCWSLERCAEVTRMPFDVINVVGGGCQIEFLNRRLADFSGRPVFAGPIEAAVLGSAAVQLIALGQLSGWDELRDVVRASTVTTVYEPCANASAHQERLAAVSEAWGVPTEPTPSCLDLQRKEI